jgi:hypothetical protein
MIFLNKASKLLSRFVLVIVLIVGVRYTKRIVK